jgi:hypothetical protein
LQIHQVFDAHVGDVWSARPALCAQARGEKDSGERRYQHALGEFDAASDPA